MNSKSEKAVFLDRDGTIIEEVNFLSTVDETALFSYTIEALGILSHNGYRLFVTTNQSGIARGYFGEAEVNAIHEKIQDELSASGIGIEKFMFCPHFPDFGCACRKPNTGMIDQAISATDIKLSESWVIGDKALDVEMGFAAETKTALVLTGYGEDHQTVLKRNPDIIAPNLLEAARLIADQR